MRESIRSLLVVAALLPIGQISMAQDARDPSRNPIPAIKADRWAEAQAAAVRFADPVTEKLVLYYRLLAPGAATAPEIAAFMHANPDWPNQALLERRRQDAIAAEPDDSLVLAQCALTPPTQAASMLRCAEALANGGRNGDATAMARNAWVGVIADSATEGVFLRRWAGITTAEDEWSRFQRLAWRDPIAAARQIPRLAPGRRATAEARLALKRDDAAADGLYGALSQVQRADPGLMLDRARYLRRANRGQEAASLWIRHGEAAQAAAPDRLTEFWSERNAVARRLLREGEKQAAYAVVAGHGQTASEARADAEFLAGFIALRYLNEPAQAKRHFTTLAAVSRAAITQGRAHYWLGRTAAATGQDPTADYTRAAAWPTTFYGQMASLALGEDTAVLADRIRTLRDPPWNPDVVLAFAAHEVVRAAAWLVAWGDPLRARAFLLRMDEIAPIAAERTLTASLALRVGLPDMAVFVARRVGRDGGMLPQAGWPMPYEPPPGMDAAVALAVMRQESSFDIGAVSTSGARGLMQLMPFTAQDVAKKLGISTSLPALTGDPAHNMKLGTTYMRDMLGRFGGSLPLAAAAYNAGPHRVDQWLAENGDPRLTTAASGGIDMVDWIEIIPFNETRNYVQRVLENVVIYRARRNEDTPTLLAQWTR